MWFCCAAMAMSHGFMPLQRCHIWSLAPGFWSALPWRPIQNGSGGRGRGGRVVRLHSGKMNSVNRPEKVPGREHPDPLVAPHIWLWHFLRMCFSLLHHPGKEKPFKPRLWFHSNKRQTLFHYISKPICKQTTSLPFQGQVLVMISFSCTWTEKASTI